MLGRRLQPALARLSSVRPFDPVPFGLLQLVSGKRSRFDNQQNVQRVKRSPNHIINLRVLTWGVGNLCGKSPGWLEKFACHEFAFC
jgi:hypothetical protein